MGSSNSEYTRLKKQIKAAKKKNKLLKKQKKYNKKRTNKKLNKKKYLSFSKAFMKIVKTKTFIISSVIVLAIILYFVILNAVEKSKLSTNSDENKHKSIPGPPTNPPSTTTTTTFAPTTTQPQPTPKPDVPSSDKSNNNVKTGYILLFVFSLLIILFMLFGWFCHVNKPMCDPDNNLLYMLIKPFEIIVANIINLLKYSGGGSRNIMTNIGKIILVVIPIFILVGLLTLAIVKIKQK